MANPSTLAGKGPGNIKVSTFRVPANNATFTPFVHYFMQPATIVRCTWVPDSGGSSPVGSLAVNTGVAGATVIACAAVSMAGDATGTPLDLPITTAANAVCAAGAIVSLTWTNTSGTHPIGTFVMHYFDTDS